MSKHFMYIIILIHNHGSRRVLLRGSGEPLDDRWWSNRLYLVHASGTWRKWRSRTTWQVNCRMGLSRHQRRVGNEQQHIIIYRMQVVCRQRNGTYILRRIKLISLIKEIRQNLFLSKYEKSFRVWSQEVQSVTYGQLWLKHQFHITGRHYITSIIVVFLRECYYTPHVACCHDRAQIRSTSTPRWGIACHRAAIISDFWRDRGGCKSNGEGGGQSAYGEIMHGRRDHLQ